MDVVALAEQLRTGVLSATEALASCLRRIDEVNGSLGAVVARDDEAAHAQARALDDAFVHGGPVGPLHGVPFTVKDWLDAAGLPCAGEAGDPGRRPGTDATAVARLRAAGGVLVGKTNVGVDHPLFGACHHPLDPTRSPGGSSSGEAAIVAAGGSPLGLGSDSGGSIRVPAAWCGVVGLRPTFGLVPATGHFPRVGGWHDGRTVIGPLATSTAGCWLALQVLAGPDGLDASTTPVPLGVPASVTIEGLRVAWLGEGTVETAARSLLDAGALAAEVPPAGHLDEAMDITQRYWHRQRLSGAEIDQLLWDWDRYRRRMLVAASGFDVLLTPVVPWPAPLARPMDDEDYRFTLTASLCGWPAASVPFGQTAEGLSLAVQIAGRAWEDHVVAATAAAVEVTAPGPVNAAGRG